MADRFPVVIHHNRDCGTSRNVLEMIQAAAYAPEVVEYLKTGWTRPQLLALLAVMGAAPRALLRQKGSPAAELGLLAPDVDDEVLLEAMVRHPILVNRPIVATPKGVALCRPSEAVFALLERRPETFTKEDGEVVGFQGSDQIPASVRLKSLEASLLHRPASSRTQRAPPRPARRAGP